MALGRKHPESIAWWLLFPVFFFFIFYHQSSGWNPDGSMHSLSVCGPEEFNCEDGSCINLDVRCEWCRIVAGFLDENNIFFSSFYSLCIFVFKERFANVCFLTSKKIKIFVGKLRLKIRRTVAWRKSIWIFESQQIPYATTVIDNLPQKNEYAKILVLGTESLLLKMLNFKGCKPWIN